MLTWKSKGEISEKIHTTVIQLEARFFTKGVISQKIHTAVIQSEARFFNLLIIDMKLNLSEKGPFTYHYLSSVAISSVFCDLSITERPVSHCETRLFDSESYSKIWLVNPRGAANAPPPPNSFITWVSFAQAPIFPSKISLTLFCDRSTRSRIARIL